MAERESSKGHQRLERGLEPRIFERGLTTAGPRRPEELHICPACSSDLVYPTDWAPADEGHWHVALRCPDCEWNGGGAYAQRMLDRLDEALDRGTEAVMDDLNMLVQADMEEQVDRFAAALENDLILPEDF
jgi:hypothetical protein